MESFTSNFISKDDFDPIDIMTIKDYLTQQLLEIFDKMPKSSKKLFLHASCIQLISYLVNTPQLEEKQLITPIRVIRTYNDYGQFPLLEEEEDQAVFIIPPDIQNIQRILEFYIKHKDRSGLVRKHFQIIFISDEGFCVTKFIQENCLTEFFNFYTLSVDLIPFDYDILSLEIADSFKEIYAEENYNTLSILAKGIVRLEMLFGGAKNKYIKGDKANELNNLLEKEEKVNEISKSDNEEGIFGLILLDRGADFICPMCSNYTYEGLIDQFFNIIYNKINVKKSIVGETKQKDKDKLELNSKTIIYNIIRNMHFTTANNFLKKKVLEIEKVKKTAQGLSTKDDLKEIREGLKEYTRVYSGEKEPLNIQLNLSNEMNNYMKDPWFKNSQQQEQFILGGEQADQFHQLISTKIGLKHDLYEVLRLLCLECLVFNGIIKYKELKRDLLNTYGYQKVFLLNNLEKAGLLKEKESSQTNYKFDKIREELELINTEFNFLKIVDCSFVFGGFTTILLKLIEALTKTGWKKIKNGLDLIPGTTFIPKDEQKNFLASKNKKKFIFVVFIGGVTFSEIEGIRFLNQINKDFKFIIITTSIINSKRIFESMDVKVSEEFTMKKFWEFIEKEDPRVKRKGKKK